MLLASVLALTALAPSQAVIESGAWCWLADPRAIWVVGRVVTGAVSSTGDIQIAIYDPESNRGLTHILADSFQVDDHDNPSLLRLPDGRVAAFFSKHSGPDMFMTTSNPAITTWSEPVAINPNDPDYFLMHAGRVRSGQDRTAYTYPNPQILSEEANRIYLFWRGMNWKPCISWSDDFGKTWAPGRILISPKDADPANRPYIKVAGDGESSIHFAFTDGHPRNEPTNSIYYVRYEDGAFFSADGKRIAYMDDLPIRPAQTDVVYDGKEESVRSWIWDIALDSNGDPVIVYTRLPAEDHHEYRYARWNGRRWVDRPIVFGGKWFPETPTGQTEREPHYSGGIALDHSDPRFVYLSRPMDGRFQIERWFTADGGDHWSHVQITHDPTRDQVRPVVIRGRSPGRRSPQRALDVV